MKNVLIIGGGMFSIPLVQKARELGMGVTCVHHDKNAPAFPFAEKTYVCDANDQQELLNIAVAEKIEAVSTISEYAALPAARLSKSLGLPGYSPEAVEIISNKHRLRQVMEKLGIPQPGFGYAANLSEARMLFEKLAKPVMVKPVNACGSRGVFKASTWSEVSERIGATLSENFSDEGLIIEEYMEGQELGGGVMFEDNRILVPGITSKFVDNNYIPIANILPGAIKGRDLEDLITMLEAIARHFNIGSNYLNVNLILTSSGPRILELGARLAGNSSPEITGLCYGVNPYEYVLCHAAGLQRSFRPSVPSTRFAAVILGSHASGIVRRISRFVDLFPSLTDLLVKEYWRCSPGDRVAKMDRTDHILGFVVIRTSLHDDLTERVKEIHNAKWLDIEVA